MQDLKARLENQNNWLDFSNGQRGESLYQQVG
jgi:hypothetical protein